MTLRLITAPVATAVSLAEAKVHLRVDAADEDALITALIGAATEAVENATGRALMTQTWEAGFDAFTDTLALTRVPVQSVTSVTYIDTAGVLQTLSSSLYTVVLSDCSFALIAPVYNTTFPALRGDIDGVKVRYVAGYTSSAAVPAAIRAAMLLVVGHLFNNREITTMGKVSDLPMGVDALLASAKVWTT